MPSRLDLESVWYSMTLSKQSSIEWNALWRLDFPSATGRLHCCRIKNETWCQTFWQVFGRGFIVLCGWMVSMEQRGYILVSATCQFPWDVQCVVWHQPSRRYGSLTRSRNNHLEKDKIQQSALQRPCLFFPDRSKESLLAIVWVVEQRWWLLISCRTCVGLSRGN